MSAYRHEIQRWARLLAFASDSAYAWGGEPVPFAPELLRLAPAEGYPVAVAAAAETLYERGYLRHEEGPKAPKDRFAQIAFGARLHEANASRFSWEGGWRFVARQGDEVVVRRGDHTRTLPAGDFDADAGLVRIPKGSSRIRPGWYYARGEQEYAPRGRPVVRLYWNVSRHGAGALLHALTSELNAARVPFHAKVVDDPQGFTRPDAGVLYVERARWRDAAPALERAHARAAPWLRSATPMLAKRLARGVAAADDPPGPEHDLPTHSFGTSRCRLVAEGCWDAVREGRNTAEGRVEAVEARFAREGLDVDRPYLNAGSEDVFDLRLVDAPVPALGGIA